MLFRSKGRKVNMDNLSILYDDNDNDNNDPGLVFPIDRIHDNHPIPDQRAYKTLGIYLDESLSLNYNTSILCKKLSKAIFILSRVRHLLPLRILKTIYHSLFHSHLNYCSTILACTSKSNTDRIFKLQKKAVRIITNSTFNAHTDPIFSRLNILPLQTIIYQSNLYLMHSIYHKYAPSSLCNLFPTNVDRAHNYELRNVDDYSLPRIRYTYLRNFPFYQLPKTWNEAGLFKLHENPIIFKRAFKEELIGIQDEELLTIFNYLNNKL